jgi:hypothetical protein
MNIPQNITISIDLNKVDEQYITKGKNGARYLDVKLVNSPDNQYGSDYFVSQSLPKAVREEVKASGGEWPKTPILGNGSAWQCMEGRVNDNKPSKAAAVADNATSVSNDDMPF